MIRQIISNGKRFLVTLRFSILSIFITLFITMVVLIILVTSRTFSIGLRYTATRIMDYASKQVYDQLSTGLASAERDSRFSAYFIEQHLLATTKEVLLPYTYFLIKHNPLAVRAYWANAAGDFISSEKQIDGTITSNIYNRSQLPATHFIVYRDIAGNIIRTVNSPDMSFDIRVIEAFQSAKQSNKLFSWSQIHRLHNVKAIGTTAITPIYQADQFVGMFGVNISLDYLSQFMTQQNITPHGFSYIINIDEQLIAYPKRKPFTHIESAEKELINVHQIGLPIVDVSLDAYKKTHLQNLFISHLGQDYLVNYQPGPNYGTDGCLIGVVTPVTDFTAPLIRMNFLNFILTLAILMFGIILVSKLVTHVVRPIKKLVNEADKIKRFDLNGHVDIKSRITEVVSLTNAFESMRLGLRQFQRYVPKMLVRQLIEAGNDTHVGGVRKELVVFFSDIKNFTTIAEKMDPNELMFQVCEYFESLTTIIIDDNKGTLDKFIGDSVMAFWGAPMPEVHPCHLAARAALQAAAKINEKNAIWAKEGKPTFETYFGLHMGTAVVGNVGSSERLNYTALGDTINIASRLEDINRFYGTHIIVSDVVYANLKDDFALRMVDRVAVRGRVELIDIYELLAENANDLPYDLAAYRAAFAIAFTAYDEERWDEAIEAFKVCQHIYAADTLAPIFILRCQESRFKL